jgi:hypothetical protein
MSFVDVWIGGKDQERLMSHLYPGDHDEHGAILRAGLVDCSDGSLRLVVQHVALAVDGVDYVAGQYGYRALKPEFIHRQIVGCRNERLAYLAVHNHHCDRHVDFSPIDMQSHERGYPALRDIGKGIPVGALVYGRRAVEADLWLSDGSRARLGEYRVIGETVRRYYSGPRTSAGTDDLYDRQLRMFGVEGQAALADAKVAIIGLGGIGSLVAEYGARLGIGHLLLIDPDAIEGTNLARVVGATRKDVAAGRLKTAISARLVRETNPHILVTEIAADVTRPDVAAQLRDCDFIFLCADSMRARLLVNAVTHQYLVPMVQLGAKVQADADGKLVDTTSVIRHVRPGEGCLWCNGFIPSGQLALEAKSDEERKAQAYGTSEPNPSVISLNAVAAAQGINDFLFDFLGLREAGDGTLYSHHHHLQRRIAKTIPHLEPECPECVERYGRGDSRRLPTMGEPVPAAALGWLSSLKQKLWSLFERS